MSKKLLASQVIEIDKKFIDSVAFKVKLKASQEIEIEKKYSVDQIAEMTNQSPRSIRNHIKDGKLKAIKITKNWIINEKDYQEYITGNS